jgi:hypothetical protein
MVRRWLGPDNVVIETGVGAIMPEPEVARRCDLVLGGRGWASAFVIAGAVDAVAQAGFRFVRVAGVAFGALIAALVATGSSTNEVATVLHAADLRNLGSKRKDNLGLWMRDLLTGSGVRTFGDLRLDDRSSSLPPERAYRLYVVAADLGSGDVVTLPYHYARYGLDPDAQVVADSVRAALGSPPLWKPTSLTPAIGGRTRLGTPDATLPLPVDIFDRTDGMAPRWPTFGVVVGTVDHEQRHLGATMEIPVEDWWPGESATDVAADVRSRLFEAGQDAARRFLTVHDSPPRPAALDTGMHFPRNAGISAAEPGSAVGARPVPLVVPTYDADGVPHGVVTDHVGVGQEVAAFAHLVAATNIDPPLAIGLFGEWGSGKTFFMRSMQAHINEITRQARESGKAGQELGVYRRIAQIEFNAWQYVEGNLWASLVAHIFDNLRTSPMEDASDLRARRERVTAELASTQEEAARAEAQISKLETRIAQTEQSLTELRRRQDDTRSQLNAARLGSLVTATLSAEDVRAVKESLEKVGISAATGRATDLAAAVQSAHAVLQHGNALVTPILQRGWRWALVLAVAILFAPAISLLLTSVDLPAVTRAAGTVAAFLGAATAVLVRGTRWLGTAMDRVQNADQRLRASVDEQHAADVTRLEGELAILRQDEEALRAERHAAQRRVGEVRERLAGLSPARMLSDFLTERGTTDDYRKHLGVTALIRRDFDRLTNLVAEHNEATGERPDNATGADFNRIVLYIDDLDRCPASRVVEVLQAVHLLLSFPLFVVVVAVDARWLTRSLELCHAEMLAGASTAAAAPATVVRATAQDYLEKIFQVPYWVLPLDAAGRRGMVQGLVGGIQWPDPAAQARPAASETSDDQIVGNVLVAADDLAELSPMNPVAGQVRPTIVATSIADRVDLHPASLQIDEADVETIANLLPILGESPRSLKRFINMYRLVKSMAEWGGNPIDTPPERSSVLLLLALITGLPGIARDLLAGLSGLVEADATPSIADPARPPTSYPGQPLTEIVERLRADAAAPAARDLDRLARWLTTAGTERGFDLDGLARWVPHISRYSFHRST